MEPVSDNVVRDAAERLGVRLDAGTSQIFLPGVTDLIAAVRSLDAVSDFVPDVMYPRTPGYRPEPEEDPLHAWHRKTIISGSQAGPLQGRTVALKDTVCVAGVPMMNGASYLEGYVPDIDATIVTRLLDAGATVVGKTNCEYLCFSGESYTNATGPTHNPRRHGYSAGGSSSGSAAAVAAGEVDIAIGGDQGGSIRIPSAFCGAYGMKPTWGLVPYTGVFPVERTLDHVGPITASLRENAVVLEVLAGPDGLDPRQGVCQIDRYSEGLVEPVAGLRIGALVEGFGLDSSDPRVDEKVMAALETLRALGADLRSVSIPFHATGAAIWTAIVLEGGLELMMLGNGAGTNAKGLYVDSLARRQAGWRANPDELPEALRVAMIAGEVLRGAYGGRYYRKAQNLARRLTKAYDRALGAVDVLALPTVPFTAAPIPADEARRDTARLTTSQTLNTAPTNCTGHPAISLPCGTIDGLPVGLMLVGQMFGERTLYRTAAGLVGAGSWLDW